MYPTEDSSLDAVVAGLLGSLAGLSPSLSAGEGGRSLMISGGSAAMLLLSRLVLDVWWTKPRAHESTTLATGSAHTHTHTQK